MSPSGRALAALTVGVALVAGACGSSSSKAATTTVAKPFWQTVPAVDMRGKAVDHVQVQVRDNSFTPEVLRIDPNVTVVWTNQGAVVHNVLKVVPNQVFGTNDFGVDKLAPGATYQYKFTTPGIYQYNCTLHTGQVGLVAVGNVNL